MRQAPDAITKETGEALPGLTLLTEIGPLQQAAAAWLAGFWRILRGQFDDSIESGLGLGCPADSSPGTMDFGL